MKLGVARKYGPDLIRYIPNLHTQNIDAFEIGFAYGPRIITEEEQKIANSNCIALSGHLPFWINLGNLNAIEKNIKYLVDGIKLAEQLKNIIVFHLGYYGNNDSKEVYSNIINCLNLALDTVKLENGYLGIETTGKQKAIGTIDEIVSIINKLNHKRVVPVIDWSHIFARSDGIICNTRESIYKVLELFENECLNKPNYFHGGSIEYKNGNEIKHISAKNLQPSMPIILECLFEKGYENSTVIIESPDSINDVNWLKNFK